MTTLDDTAPPGFNFDNVSRNASLQATLGGTNTSLESITKAAKKTGTTIAGLIFSNGVVLGADTRATNGTEIAEKDCMKIHDIADNIYCCGAGTAADTDQVTKMIQTNLKLLRLNMNGEPSRVVTATNMLKKFLHRYQGHIGAHLILGGCDLTGPHLYDIHAAGSTSYLPYATNGSGCLAAMGVFETEYKAEMDEASAIELVKRAIAAGIFNDLGSGSNCTIRVIRMDGTTDLMKFTDSNDVSKYRSTVTHTPRLNLPVGVSPILTTKVTHHPPTFKEQFASIEEPDTEMEE